MQPVEITLTYGSDAYRQVVADTLPELLTRAGVDDTIPFFFITAEERDRYPIVNIIGPNNSGHWATLEVKSDDGVMAPDSNDAPEGARAVLALYEPETFFEQYRPAGPVVGPELGDVPFDVVWARFWLDSFPDIQMRLKVAETVEPSDLERQLWIAVEARAARFEDELRRARKHAPPYLTEFMKLSREPDTVDKSRQGGVKEVTVSRDAQDRISIHLDFFSSAAGSGDRLVALWVDAIADLTQDYQIERVTVGLT